MKILHLSAQDTGGGAADAAHRLHSNMRTAGIDSRMLVLRKTGSDPFVTDASTSLGVLDSCRRIRSMLSRRRLRRRYAPSAYFYVDSRPLSMSQLRRRCPFAPDAIVAHWISGFLDAASLAELGRRLGAPVLWYMLDLAPATGGCHYAFGCRGFADQCGNCPQLAAHRGPRDLSRRQWSSKATGIAEGSITAVAGSSWLRQQLDAASAFRGQRHETILMGVDAERFSPGSQAVARSRLGLPDARTVVLFGASSLDDERKGLRCLLDALQQLNTLLASTPLLRERILVVSAGQHPEAVGRDIGFEHRHIGFLRGDDALADAYRAADVFVCPSVEDAGPMMINEALLCGTPVVSFDMGVAEDLVHRGRTGYRARLRDTGDLAEGLREILMMSDDERGAMRARCRQFGMERCHPRVQVDAFVSLCSTLIRDARTAT